MTIFNKTTQTIIDSAIKAANNKKTGFAVLDTSESERKSLLAERTALSTSIKNQKAGHDAKVESLSATLGLLSMQAYIANDHKAVPCRVIANGAGIPTDGKIPNGIRTPWSQGSTAASQFVDGSFTVGGVEVTTEQIVKGALPDGVTVYGIYSQVGINKKAAKDQAALTATRDAEELAQQALAGDIYVKDNGPIEFTLGGETINCATGQDIASQFRRGPVIGIDNVLTLGNAIKYGQEILALQVEQDERLGAVSSSIRTLDINAIMTALADCTASEAKEAQEAVQAFLNADFAGLLITAPATVAA